MFWTCLARVISKFNQHFTDARLSNTLFNIVDNNRPIHYFIIQIFIHFIFPSNNQIELIIIIALLISNRETK